MTDHREAIADLLAKLAHERFHELQAGTCPARYWLEHLDEIVDAARPIIAAEVRLSFSHDELQEPFLFDGAPAA